MSTTSIDRTAATRVGISVDEYRALRRSGLKYCWRCRSWRPVSGFGPDASRGDGLAARCSSCRRRPRQVPLITPTAAERDRLRYATDERYRLERRQHAHARKRGVAPLPIEGIETLMERFAGLCAYCPAPATTWDHIVPVAEGGKTVPGNMLPACVSCNSRKGTLDIHDFIEKYDVVISAALDDAIALAHAWGQLTHG